MYIYIYIYIYVYIYVFVCVCTCTYIDIHMCIYIHMNIYIYIHTIISVRIQHRDTLYAGHMTFRFFLSSLSLSLSLSPVLSLHLCVLMTPLTRATWPITFLSLPLSLLFYLSFFHFQRYPRHGPCDPSPPPQHASGLVLSARHSSRGYSRRHFRLLPTTSCPHPHCHHYPHPHPPHPHISPHFCRHRHTPCIHTHCTSTYPSRLEKNIF